MADGRLGMFQQEVLTPFEQQTHELRRRLVTSENAVVDPMNPYGFSSPSPFAESAIEREHSPSKEEPKPLVKRSSAKTSGVDSRHRRAQSPLRSRQAQHQQQRQQQQQQPDNRVWLANVFQRVYGAGFNQPNGYQYTVSEEKDERGNIVRSIRIFRPDDANAPSYVFRSQPDKTWTLYSGDGRELIRNVYYDPKTKRFFVVGVSEDDVLKTLQPQTLQMPQSPQTPQQVTIPGAVWFQMLDENTAVAKTIDNKIRVLRNAGNNQWMILREMDYDELINPTVAPPSTAPDASGNGNNQEQSMNWLYFLLPLLAIILSRR